MRSFISESNFSTGFSSYMWSVFWTVDLEPLFTFLFLLYLVNF